MDLKIKSDSWMYLKELIMQISQNSAIGNYLRVNSTNSSVESGGRGNPIVSVISSLGEDEASEYLSNLQSLSKDGKDELKMKLDDIKENLSSMSKDEVNEEIISALDEVFSDERNFATNGFQSEMMPPPPPPPPPMGGANSILESLSELDEDETEEFLETLQSLSNDDKSEIKDALSELQSEDLTDEEISESFLSIISQYAQKSDSMQTGVVFNGYA